MALIVEADLLGDLRQAAICVAQQGARTFQPQTNDPRVRRHTYGLLEKLEKMEPFKVAEGRKFFQGDLLGQMNIAIVPEAPPRPRPENDLAPIFPLRFRFVPPAAIAIPVLQ